MKKSSSKFLKFKIIIFGLILAADLYFLFSAPMNIMISNKIFLMQAENNYNYLLVNDLYNTIRQWNALIIVGLFVIMFWGQIKNVLKKKEKKEK